jgi:antagonist of KipI
MSAQLRVVRPGLLTTVQDQGRFGLQAFGVSVAGAMDPRAHRVANLLVANAPGAASLEVTLAGPEIEFDDDRFVAVAGGTFDLAVSGARVPMETAFPVSTGSRLSFGARSRGARAYVAVSGGIDVPLLFGSRSTHLGSRMGGFEGRALARGDRLPLGGWGGRPPLRRAGLAGAPGSVPVGHARVRVLPGLQPDRFPDTALDVLQAAPYTVGAESNRMGYRLTGARLPLVGGADMISDATPLGALQVPPSGQPVLLMADRQTTGGYPVIATVISADLGLVAQLAPGDTIEFALCAPREALTALVADERAIMAFEAPA